MLVPNVSAGLPQPDLARLEQLKELSRRLEFRFRDYRLYDLALTHSSYSNEPGSHRMNNQRLEYFGDSIIGFIVNEHLFLDYKLSEGQMARIKSAAVSEKSLASAARALRFGAYLRMSKGERKSGGSRRPSNLADAFEAFVAAIYIDRGMKQARQFVVGMLDSRLRNLSQSGRALDPKSALQELVQKQFRTHPVYELVSQEGPDHKREFVYRVVIDSREIARGMGSSRKRAERQAAIRALDLLRE
ncbi:MAG: ribonuclease III [Leptonema illini]|uniref:Ribonuclease 3 n=2 Tax=Leptonema illini TaxID=183 RepID=H2CEG3_9LEPT|nr:ribonuclease III [Leptonema illini]EHQ05549.1 Ribonuclease 3 [Leptonema illini DSM 21528]KAB2932063.1 MAG: ribonuclease III [Leptonema illini]PKL34367.1 MAG: ribonuclease III [Spirochaetae bacterium HGW-Spirochaetae-10]